MVKRITLQDQLRKKINNRPSLLQQRATFTAVFARILHCRKLGQINQQEWRYCTLETAAFYAIITIITKIIIYGDVMLASCDVGTVNK